MKKTLCNATVLVAALGYFVDMFDITLFGVVRTASLHGIGITDPELVLTWGVRLYNLQMIGMMIGGLLWGYLADRYGRLQVMFGSILLYSLGNIANAFVGDVETYAVCRFITGIGLAGELGAAITIVAESLPKETRGLGTTIVATLGLCGSVAAALIGQHLHWQSAYLLGGSMGLLLLLGRWRLAESGMFEKLRAQNPDNLARWDLLLKPRRLGRYFACVLVGVPVYFITGILFTFSPEITKALGTEGVVAGQALLFGSIGLAIGDMLSGLLSQFLRSRRKAITICLLSGFALASVLVLATPATPDGIYVLCFFAGLCAGYWAVLVTMAAEQFGTDVRGGVATTVPNFVRGSAVFVTLGFSMLKGPMGLGPAVLTLAVAWFGAALLGLWFLRETFGVDLDYLETDRS